MKISVVTVTYNSAATLEETMLSVLNQTYDNIEYIIIDGGSTDGTVDIIKKYAERIAYWISEPDTGIYDAMNKGISVATGDYINFMNSGDEFASNETISLVLKYLQPGVDIAYGNTYFKFKSHSLLRKPLLLSEIRTKPPFCHQSSFIRRDFQLRYPYDLKYRIAADYNFFYLGYFERNASFQYIPEIVSVFNCAEGTSTDNLTESMNEKFRIWGIEHNWKLQMPWRISLIRSRFSHKLKQLLPSKLVVKIKKLLDSTRIHVDE